MIKRCWHACDCKCDCECESLFRQAFMAFWPGAKLHHTSAPPPPSKKASQTFKLKSQSLPFPISNFQVSRLHPISTFQAQRLPNIFYYNNIYNLYYRLGTNFGHFQALFKVLRFSQTFPAKFTCIQLLHILSIIKHQIFSHLVLFSIFYGRFP